MYGLGDAIDGLNEELSEAVSLLKRLINSNEQIDEIINDAHGFLKRWNETD